MLSLFFLMAAFPCLNALGINTSTGNFPCNKCGRPFHDLTQSILHEDECTSPRCMEDVDVPVTADNAPFSCDDCAKTFPSLNSWIAHSQFNRSRSTFHSAALCTNFNHLSTTGSFLMNFAKGNIHTFLPTKASTSPPLGPLT